MLVPARYREPIQRGEITVLFRRWKRSQAVAGRVYRTSAGRLEVTGVRTVDPERISKVDARRAGFTSPAEVRSVLRGDPAVEATYRIEVRAADGPDPRSALAADDVLDAAATAELERRLDRLDRASSAGPWTRPTLRLIADHPAVLAADLAASVGRERAPFKLDVRKLKNLGLTHSLRVGYELSPRGRAYLDRTAETTRGDV